MKCLYPQAKRRGETQARTCHLGDKDKGLVLDPECKDRTFSQVALRRKSLPRHLHTLRRGGNEVTSIFESYEGVGAESRNLRAKQIRSKKHFDKMVVGVFVCFE